MFTAADGAEVANVNCLMCHLGRFNGEQRIGLGNADSDFTAGFGVGDGGGGSAGLGIGFGLGFGFGLWGNGNL